MKMNLTKTLILIGSVSVISCTAVDSIKPSEKEASQALYRTNLQVLDQGNWSDYNYVQLKQLITQYGKASPDYQAQHPSYAVFDFDNTSVFLDIEEATFIHQLNQLKFKVTPERLNQIIRKDISHKNFNSEFNNSNLQPVNIDSIAFDIYQSYSWLYKNYNGFEGQQSLNQIEKTEHYHNFRTKMRYLYEAISGSFDHKLAYAWITYLFEGFRDDEIRSLTKESYNWQLQQPIEKVTWTSSKTLTGKAGVVSVSWQNGLKPYKEMQNLYRVLQNNGIDVYVISASFSEVIKEMASNPQFGFNIPVSNVYAVQLERDTDGKVVALLNKNEPLSFGEGKSQIIQKYLVKKYGYGPIFIAGDSRGDVNMMQDFSDTQKVLIINRLSSSDHSINQLAKLAISQDGQEHSKYLLQGRDANTGQFIRNYKSIALGETQTR